MSTHNICFCREIRKKVKIFIWLHILSGTMTLTVSSPIDVKVDHIMCLIVAFIECANTEDPDQRGLTRTLLFTIQII